MKPKKKKPKKVTKSDIKKVMSDLASRDRPAIKGTNAAKKRATKAAKARWDKKKEK